MRVGDLFPSKFVKPDDLRGHEVEVIIDNVSTQDFQDGSRAILFFQGKSKGMILNKTNGHIIAKAYGDETNAWRGKPLLIFPSETLYQGQMKPTIVVRIPKRDTADEWQAPLDRPQAAPAANGPALAPPPATRDDYGARVDDEIPF